MNDTSIETIKQQHGNLYGELQSELLGVAKPFGGDTPRRGDFLKRVDILLDNIAACAETFDDASDEFYWINNAIAAWQFAFSSLLGLPKTVPVIQSSVATKLHPALEDKIIRHYMADLAHGSYVARKEQKLARYVGEAWDRLQRSSSEEMLDDWNNAQLCFASDILSGEGKLWDRLGAKIVPVKQRWSYFTYSTFDTLKKVWLQDVIRMHAYTAWVKSGAQVCTRDVADLMYFQECRKLLNQVNSASNKFDEREAIEMLENYFSDEYNNGAESSRNLNDIIRLKAQKIFDITQGHDQLADWQRASAYTKQFYENVISASKLQDPMAMQRLRDAFELSEHPKYQASIMTCFEAAVLIYYISDIYLPDVWPK